MTESKLKDDLAIDYYLTFEISGVWDTKSFVGLFSAIESYYGAAKLISVYKPPSKEGELLSLDPDSMPVSSISYHSPGWVELLIQASGTAGILGGTAGILALLLKPIMRYIPNQQERIEMKIKEQELWEKQIQNISDSLTLIEAIELLAREKGIDDDTKKQLKSQLLNGEMSLKPFFKKNVITDGNSTYVTLDPIITKVIVDKEHGESRKKRKKPKKG